ncbi:MAG: RNA polymerase factor sigma-32 [Myxococcales bacterium]|nr:RNA polymerase factor sigma-32 [Myxococcales bacterium]
MGSSISGANRGFNDELREQAYVADPMQRYLAEIRGHAVLARDEERTLAIAYQETGSLAIERKLVNANLRLVVKLALEYQSIRVPLLDLVQEGNVGLIHAVRKFDPDKNIRLASYAQWWIRAYILKYLMDNHKLVKVGTTQAQRKLFYNLRKEADRLQRQGISPTPGLLARALSVRESDVVEMSARLAGRETSFDAPLADADSGTLADLVPSDETPVDERLATAEESDTMRRRLDEFSETLTGRDRAIWAQRIVAESPETLQEIGQQFGVSRERARQLEARIKQRLTRFLTDGVEDGAAA